MTKKQRKIEFTENRTSWKWFKRKTEAETKNYLELQTGILLEILKEIQYLNDN